MSLNACAKETDGDQKFSPRKSATNQGDFAASRNLSSLSALFIRGSAGRFHHAHVVADTRRNKMRKFAKIALGAMLLAGAATAMASAPADARVVVGVGVGPGYYGPAPAPYPYDYNCAYYGYCGYPAPAYPAYYGGYYGPSIALGFGGGWHGGGHWHGGHGHH
jgi:hypothetical protein